MDLKVIGKGKERSELALVWYTISILHLDKDWIKHRKYLGIPNVDCMQRATLLENAYEKITV